MRRYLGIAIGLGLLLVVLSVTNAGPALAQGAVRPLMAFIVNDNAHPVPVSVVAPPPTTTTVCTLELGTSGSSSPFLFSGAGGSTLVSTVQCPAGVSALDVSRIVYAPDVAASSAFRSSNVSKYRMTVGHGPAGPTGFPGLLSPSNVLAVLTDGAPDAAVVQPYRLDLTANSEWIQTAIAATSGLVGSGVTLGGSLVFIGTPVQ